MSSWQHQQIQELVDIRISELTQDHPNTVGAAVTWVSVDTPGGDKVFSTTPIKLRNDELAPIQGDTPFCLASVSKVFTTGIYNMLANGNWGGSIYDALDPPARDQISETVQTVPIQQLGAYTSGFQQDNGHCAKHTGFPVNLTDSLVDFFNFLSKYGDSKYPQAYTPGDMYSYSNLANGLLLMCAVHLASPNDPDAFLKTIQDELITYCQKHFDVNQNQLDPTTTYYEPMPNKDALPYSYTVDNEVWTRHDQAPVNLAEYGSGGVVSTTDDMFKFLQYCMSWNYPSPLRNYYWNQLPQWCNPNTKHGYQGYGWGFPIRHIQGLDWIIQSKNGSKRGFTAWIGMHPGFGRPSTTGVVALMNGAPSVYDATDLGTEIFDLVFDPGPGSKPVENAVPTPAEPAPDPSIH